MPLSGEKNDVSKFSQSSLIGSLSNLQIPRTGIKARMNSKLGRIGLVALELFALEHGNFFPMDIMEKMMSPLFLSCLQQIGKVIRPFC